MTSDGHISKTNGTSHHDISGSHNATTSELERERQDNREVVRALQRSLLDSTTR